MWSWLSYMNPHRLTWGFAYDMPFAQIVAITLILAVLFNKDKRNLPITPTTTVWIVFLLWMGITTALAIYPDRAFDYYVRIIKIQLVTFFTLMLITDKERVNALIWVIVLSIGFYSIKGGAFTILTGGSYRVYGPSDSFIAENNGLAVATLMIIPLFYYLSKSVSNKWLKRFFIMAIVLSLASAVGSQSRGALITLAAVSGYFWWQSKTKIITGITLVIVLSLGWMFMPESWHERMDTISNYEEDASAMGRIQAWEYSINIANDRVTGGGLNSWSPQTYAIYRPGSIGHFVAHSIYFNVLADHGWLGLGMFLLILYLTWRNLSIVVSTAPKTKNHQEMLLLAQALKVSLIAYMSGGVFLSLSYFDLPWHMMCLAVIVRLLVEGDVNLGGEPANMPEKRRLKTGRA